MNAPTAVRRFLLKSLLVLAFLGPAAAMSPYLVASFLATQATAAVRTIDGSNADWQTGTRSPVPGCAVLAYSGADTEWVFRDKLDDARDGASGWWTEDKANWDIKEVRITGDATYLYIYTEVKSWHAWDGGSTGDQKFQLNLAIDTEVVANPAGGTAGFNWIGDQSNTLLGTTAQNSEINVILDHDGIYKFQGAGPWARIGLLGDSIAFNQAGGFMEARMKWTDLGFTAIPPRLRFSVASARRMKWGSSPEHEDKTETLASSPGTSQMLDALSAGYTHHTGEWEDDLSDADVDFYVDVAFNAAGQPVDTRPTRPLNVRVYDPIQKSWFTGGETILTNNPILQWNQSHDSDVGDTVTGYFIQICTTPVVSTGGTDFTNGFFHTGYNPSFGVNSTGNGPLREIAWVYREGGQSWWGASDSSSGIPNAYNQTTPYLLLGQTYYIRVWARDRRGMLSLASNTCTVPIDYPVWHDPYTFGSNGKTMRGNRDPKENANVDFSVGCWDPAPLDPKDNPYTSTGGDTTPKEILNVVLFIRVNRAGHFTYDAGWNNMARIILGRGSEWGGQYRWYTPQTNFNDTHSLWYTGWADDPSPTFTARTPSAADWTFVKTGAGAGLDYGLQAVAGDVVEYFFEINMPSDAPHPPTHPEWRQAEAPRRFLIAYDNNGITGYRMGTWDEAKANPFRFVVQKRDLLATWHNPLSAEVPLGPGGDTLAMRTPMWPDTAPQTVKMYVGCIGWGEAPMQIVWRNVDGGAWTTTNFNPTDSALVDTSAYKYYYWHNFNYTGGMIEYYFKLSSNDLFIFANGITTSADTVYDNSIGNEGVKSVPFRFPYTSRVKITSTGSTAKDSHSMVAVLGYKAPRFDAMNENAIGTNGVLDLRGCSAAVTGNAFSNVFPGANLTLRDTSGAAQPHRLIGRSYFAMLTAVGNVITGVRKAFFGPIYPLDYAASDSTKWNTGSDAYENVPILPYDEVFSAVVERTKPAGTTFSAAESLEGVVYVPGNATINSLSVTKGALIAEGSITIPAGASITAERLDLCALNGTLRIAGAVTIETGILFSNTLIQVDTTANIKIRKLGAVMAQNVTFASGSALEIVHPPTVSYSATQESVLTRATRWVISALREQRR